MAVEDANPPHCKEQQRQQVAERTPEEKWQLAFDKLPDQEKVDTLLFGKEKIVTDRSLGDRVEWMECRGVNEVRALLQCFRSGRLVKGMLNTAEELSRRLSLPVGPEDGTEDGRKQRVGGGRAAATSAQLPHRHPEGARESFPGRRAAAAALTP